MIKSLIVAIASNGVIGKKNGEMPWHIKEEFQHFKKTTLGFPVIMGRKTFETLGKPLKDRLNIIVTKNKSFKSGFDETLVFNSLNSAIDFCEREKKEKIFIIGGGEIYKQAIDLVDEMIISEMKFDAEGEVEFPKIDSTIWKKELIDDRDQFTVYRYTRK